MSNLALTVQHLFPNGRPFDDWVISDLGSGPFISQWRRAEPQPTPAEIAAAEPAAVAARDARLADDAQYQTERAELQSQLQTAAARLTQIKDAASMTNAQVFNAVKDLAQIQLRMLKYLRRL